MKPLEFFHFGADIAIIGSVALIAGSFLVQTSINSVVAFFFMLSGAILLLAASVVTLGAITGKPIFKWMALLVVGIAMLFVASAFWIAALIYPIIF